MSFQQYKQNENKTLRQREVRAPPPPPSRDTVTWQCNTHHVIRLWGSPPPQELARGGSCTPTTRTRTWLQKGAPASPRSKETKQKPPKSQKKELRWGGSRGTVKKSQTCCQPETCKAELFEKYQWAAVLVRKIWQKISTEENWAHPNKQKK